MLIGIYIFYNLVYALSAFPLGAIADKIGLKENVHYWFALVCRSIFWNGCKQ
jgi:hypothetical protein